MLWVCATTMWPQGTVLQVYLWMLLLSTAYSIPNTTYSLASLCEEFNGHWETLLETDTVIQLHDGSPSVKNCTLIVRTFPGSTIYVKLKYWTAPDPASQCTTELQLYEPGQPIKQLRDKSCVYPVDAGITQSWSAGGIKLHATFTSTSGPHQFKSSTKSGLSIIFIKSTDSEKCRGSKYFQCDGMCIDNGLLCDKVSHCIKGEDEILSRCKDSWNAPNPATHTTTMPLVPTTPGELTSDIYLWLPLIVVIVFTIVMLALILAGRGAANCSEPHYRPTQSGELLVASPTPLSTGPPKTTNQPEFGDDNVEVISIIMVAVVFLCVVCGFAILGFREQRQRNQEETITYYIKPELLVAPTPSSTGPPTTTIQLEFGDDNVDIITIILVAVVFLVILIGCAILGFREQRNRRREQTLNDGLRLETNSGFIEGGPPTPPPTYSYIERQTSYVSNISQSDSQISIPPAYEDAVDLADDPMSWRRRFQRHLSRSSSSRSSSGTTRPSSNRHRLFQRSMSAQDAPSAQGRISSNTAARTRHASDHTAGQIANRDSVASDTDSVFIDTPGTSAQTLSPHSTTAPSALENVSEVDETLGSSLMLGPEGGANNGVTTVNAAINNTAAQPGVNDQNGEPRPILARSISDVTSGQAVIFSID